MVSTAMISRRPKNIATDKIHFAVSLSPEKLPDGPISVPRPGPMFAIADAAPETEVIKSNPVSPSIVATMPRAKTKATKNAMTELRTSSDTGRPS